jgi:hypothetical protein
MEVVRKRHAMIFALNGDLSDQHRVDHVRGQFLDGARALL